MTTNHQLNYLELGIWTLAITIFGFGLNAHYGRQFHSEFVMLKLLGGFTRTYKSIESDVSLFQLPKKYFAHFYIFGVTLQSIIFYTYCVILLNGFGSGNWLFQFTKPVVLWLETLNEIVGSHSCEAEPASVPTTVLTSFLFLLHLSRRLYETLVVFIYSKSSKMTIVVYGSSIMFYFSAMLSLISIAPPLEEVKPYSGILELLGSFWEEFSSWHIILGILIIIYGSIGQHKVHCTLAALRKGKDNQIKSLDHFIPIGGLYQLISCPNYWCEILIYVGFSILFEFRNGCWNAIVGLVAANQIIAGLLSHEWYLKTFPDYPKNRKAIIPYFW